MPSSDVNMIPVVVNWMMQVNPQTILDVGAGFGKYGFLAREYLEIWGDKPKEKQWEVVIDGLEPFYEYTHLGKVYSKIYKFTLQDFDFTWSGFMDYDLIILADVLEHLEKEEALEQLARCKKHSKWVIVTTPKGYREQGAVFDNELETHKCGFHPTDFYPYEIVTQTTNNFAVLIKGDK